MVSKPKSDFQADLKNQSFQFFFDFWSKLNFSVQFENLHEKMLYLVAQALTSDALEDDSQTAEKIMNICLNAKRVSCFLVLAFSST